MAVRSVMAVAFGVAVVACLVRLGVLAGMLGMFCRVRMFGFGMSRMFRRMVGVNGAAMRSHGISVSPARGV